VLRHWRNNHTPPHLIVFKKLSKNIQQDDAADLMQQDSDQLPFRDGYCRIQTDVLHYDSPCF